MECLKASLIGIVPLGLLRYSGSYQWNKIIADDSAIADFMNQVKAHSLYKDQFLGLPDASYLKYIEGTGCGFGDVLGGLSEERWVEFFRSLDAVLDYLQNIAYDIIENVSNENQLLSCILCY